jgi:two-component system response regulator FixJ
MNAGVRVLVVDDDDGMRNAIETLLLAAGYSASVYASAESLLDGGEIEGAMCIISDLMLPAMSGLDLLDELRRRGARLPVILITAHDAANVRAEAVRRGVAAYLPKPFSGVTLLGALRSCGPDPLSKPKVVSPG